MLIHRKYKRRSFPLWQSLLSKHQPILMTGPNPNTTKPSLASPLHSQICIAIMGFSLLVMEGASLPHLQTYLVSQPLSPNIDSLCPPHSISNPRGGLSIHRSLYIWDVIPGERWLSYALLGLLSFPATPSTTRRHSLSRSSLSRSSLSSRLDLREYTRNTCEYMSKYIVKYMLEYMREYIPFSSPSGLWADSWASWAS